LHDSGHSGAVLFYVMPFVEGESLRDRLRRSDPLLLDEALKIGREAAEALGHAHRNGVIHRDIKPENILLSSGHALVADFGIARALHLSHEDPTSAGISLATPAYMSPEQIEGGEVDGRTDVYSLGCVLYEMLVGAPPFAGAAHTVMTRHVLDPPPRI